MAPERGARLAAAAAKAAGPGVRLCGGQAGRGCPALLAGALTVEEATGDPRENGGAGRKLARPVPAWAAPVTAEVRLADPAGPVGDTTAAGAAPPVLDQRFNAGMLPLLREAVLAHAAAAGMPQDRAGDVMLAVHELASNAIRHGGGAGQLRIWAGPGRCAARSTTPARPA